MILYFSHSISPMFHYHLSTMKMEMAKLDWTNAPSSAVAEPSARTTGPQKQNGVGPAPRTQIWVHMWVGRQNSLWMTMVQRMLFWFTWTSGR